MSFSPPRRGFASSPLQRPAVAAGPDREDLGQDRQGRLGLGVGADVQPTRAGDPLEGLLRHARLEQPLAAALLVAPRAERADVERLGLERPLQRRLVELVVVREDDDRGRVVGRDPVERFLGPLDDQLVGAGDPLGGRELRPRVGDDRRPAEQLRRAAERLGSVDGAVDEQSRRRPVDTRRRRLRRRSRARAAVAAAADQFAELARAPPPARRRPTLAALDDEHSCPRRLPSTTVKSTARSSRSIACRSRSSSMPTTYSATPSKRCQPLELGVAPTKRKPADVRSAASSAVVRSQPPGLTSMFRSPNLASGSAFGSPSSRSTTARCARPRSAAAGARGCGAPPGLPSRG